MDFKRKASHLGTGLPWHYNEWGTLENGVNVRAVPPDNQGMTRHQFLWTRCQRLTSVDHGTLGEYIRAKVKGESLDPFRGRGKPLSPARVGQMAPLFTAKTLDGSQTIRMQDLQGKVVLLNLWSPTDPSSRRQSSQLSSMVDWYKNDPVVILSLAPDYAAHPEKIRELLQKWNPKTIELLPEKELSEAFKANAQGYPTVYLIGKTGVIEKQYLGCLNGDEDRLYEIEKYMGLKQSRIRLKG